MAEHISTLRQGSYEYTVLLECRQPSNYEWEVIRVRWTGTGTVQVGSPVTIAEGNSPDRDTAIARAHDARQQTMVLT